VTKDEKCKIKAVLIKR